MTPMHITVFRLEEWEILFRNGTIAGESRTIGLDDVERQSNEQPFTLAVIDAKNTLLDAKVTEQGHAGGLTLETAHKLSNISGK